MNPNDLIGFARDFASITHAQTGQTYDGKPYSAHLEDVVEVLMRFGETDKVTLAAGYLHDVVEDAGVKISTIEDLFGPKVATLVGALTDEPGANRKERKAATYPKIRATPGAVMLKLADRIANLENGLKTKNKRMVLMYSKEHFGFEMALRRLDDPEIVHRMWNHAAHLMVRAATELEIR
jgi:(p)ppGpp synthase/HD superfamily hydrolase